MKIATGTALHPRAIDAHRPALERVRADRAYIMIIDATTGQTRAHPRHCAIPPGWYRLAIHIKEPRPCAA